MYLSWMTVFITIILGRLFKIYYFTIISFQIQHTIWLGFTKDDEILYAVVQQSYVSITAKTDLNQGQEFLTLNGLKIVTMIISNRWNRNYFRRFTWWKWQGNEFYIS
jgi:hypothetical protein